MWMMRRRCVVPMLSIHWTTSMAKRWSRTALPFPDPVRERCLGSRQGWSVMPDQRVIDPTWRWHSAGFKCELRRLGGGTMRKITSVFMFIAVVACVPAASWGGEARRPLRPVSTYSIVARDAETGELGAAVQSHWFSVGSIVTWAEPGIGAVATQSLCRTELRPAGPAAHAGRKDCRSGADGIARCR